MRDIRNMIDEIGGFKNESSSTLIGESKNGLSFSETHYVSEQNKKVPMFELGSKAVQLLVTGYSVVLRLKVLDRLEELETASSQPKQLTNKDLALMVIAESERAEKAELQLVEKTKMLEEITPKAQYTELVLLSDNTYTTTQIAKELDFSSAILLHKKLKEKKIMYKQSGSWVLYSEFTGKGYIKTRTYTHIDSKGNTQSSSLTVWTETGRQFLHSLFNSKLSKATA